MSIKRGDVWLADLNPTRGSEQAGTRPVLVFHHDLISRFTTTLLAIPLTTNLRRASLPSCVRIAQGEGGLAHESVALCHHDTDSLPNQHMQPTRNPLRGFHAADAWPLAVYMNAGK